MRFKQGISLSGVKPEIVLAMMVAESVLRKMGSNAELVVTSCNDGQHMVGSKHFDGQAFDARTRNLTPGEQKTLVEALQQALTAQFDVVLEPDHIHVEFDPKPKT